MWLLPFLTHVEKLCRQLFSAHCSLNNGNDNVSRQQQKNREWVWGSRKKIASKIDCHIFLCVFAVQAISNSISCPYSANDHSMNSTLVYKVWFRTYALPFSWMVRENKCHFTSHSNWKWDCKQTVPVQHSIFIYTHTNSPWIHPFNEATQQTSLPASIHWLVWCNLYNFMRKKKNLQQNIILEWWPMLHSLECVRMYGIWSK